MSPPLSTTTTVTTPQHHNGDNGDDHNHNPNHNGGNNKEDHSWDQGYVGRARAKGQRCRCVVSPQVRCFSFFFSYYICTNDYIQIPKSRMSPLKNRTRTKGDTRAGAQDADVSRESSPGMLLLIFQVSNF